VKRLPKENKPPMKPTPVPAVPDAPPEEPRGRPGRRSAEDRQEAVLELIAGKATLDQLARRFGVHPDTVESWRADALSGIAQALRRGCAKSERELELERENKNLKHALTEAVMEKTLLKRALDQERQGRPSPPTRSRR
jgi:transposase-like protein